MGPRRTVKEAEEDVSREIPNEETVAGEEEEEEEEEEEAPFQLAVPEDLETQRRLLWAVDFFYALEDDRVRFPSFSHSLSFGDVFFFRFS
jgi:hypothetical protein